MDQAVADRITQLVLDQAKRLAPERGRYDGREIWQALGRVGTEMWLDTGDLEEANALWSAEFSGLTTNNTLLNREVQKGTYDDLVSEVWRELKDTLDRHQAIMELAFVLNAVHGLRLVARFDCRVSVELHTDIANDVERTLAYARRYHEICPDRFIIKVPLAPSGMIATRRLNEEGITVNLTLGFSARQNFLAAALARPGYVNVFLGRLNAVVADNGIGDGRNVGEKVTLASQRSVKEVNRILGTNVRQIAASLRAGAQVATLAGVDVHTIPPKVAKEFVALEPAPEDLRCRLDEDLDISVAPGFDADALGLSRLWDVPETFKSAALTLGRKNPHDLSPAQLRDELQAAGCGDLVPDWSDEDIRVAQNDGKIPQLERWQERLANGEIGLDALMNLSALMAFTTDQAAMDERIEGLIE